MNIHFKIQREFIDSIRRDLSRPHEFAYERVGFIGCKAGRLGNGAWIILAALYYSVADEDYVEDDSVGALIGSAAIRKMMQVAYDEPLSIFHVHMHEHRGIPRPSPVDIREMGELIPNFWHVRENLPHGAIVLSRDSLSGTIWDPSLQVKRPIDDITVVGTPMQLIRGNHG